MDLPKITSDASDLFNSIGLSVQLEPSSVREVAETLANVDLSSIDFGNKLSQLVSLARLSQQLISFLLVTESNENVRNPSNQLEKLQSQNKKLRYMLQLHQKSFLQSILSTNSCTHCPKSFIDEGHLEAHFQRRHEQSSGENESFPLLDRINEYRGLSKVKNEQFEQFRVQIDDMKSQLEVAQKKLQEEREERLQFEQTILQQLDLKINQIEKRITNFFQSPTNDDGSNVVALHQLTGQEQFAWAQIAVLKHLATEVASLKENFTHQNQSRKQQSYTVNDQEQNFRSVSYDEVESLMKKKLDELNIDSTSTGISEDCLENALKHIKEERISHEKDEIDSMKSNSTNSEVNLRPVPTVRTSIGPTSILKKSKSSDQVESTKEPRKIQWSNGILNDNNNLQTKND